MLTEKHISTIDELLPLISDQLYNPELDRYRGHYLYRGIPDSSYRLVTSLTLNCKGHKTALEQPLLRNFTKYAAIDDPTIERSVWRQMILGQHHGLPTRLLDWSHSSLIGLHFAVTENNLDDMEKRDCVVWRIDMTELHSMLPKKYLDTLARYKTTICTVEMLESITTDLSEYDRDMGDSAMIVVEPPSVDPRIVNQYSFFTVIPSSMTDIELFLERNTSNTVKYVIDRSIRWQIRDMLDQLNISERLVYPGLDGLSKWLARHYFVK